MLSQTLFFWSVLLVYLIPILLTGIIIMRRVLWLDRLELLIPAGSILGITMFVFIINITSFFIKGFLGINLSYIFLLLLLLFLYFKKSQVPRLILPSSKLAILYLLSIIFWGFLIFWKGNFALIGSDTNLYYAVAHTFIRGNAPSFTPWQPDLPLVYHLGAFQLLGAFYSFTNLSFEFLHIFFSCLFIFCSSQIIIWLWKKNDSITSFIWGNLAAAIVLISFGFLKFVIPISAKFPEVSNLHQFFLWIRNLPLVDHSIEAYGAPVNLDILIYFIFHSFGLALVLCLIVLIIYSKQSQVFYKWIIFAIGLSTLSLINESVFVLSSPALIIGGILKELQSKNFLGKSKLIFAVLVTTSIFILIQGGTITNLILGPNTLEKSVLIFPSNSDKGEALISYHHNQTVSKQLPLKDEWLPFQWFHIGNDILILICLVFLIFVKFSKEQKNILIILFVMGISSILAYFNIVPKYLAANGNRFLAFAFISFSLFVIYSSQNLFENLGKKLGYFMLIILVMFVLAPSILPPLVMLSKTRFGENKLMPKKERTTTGVEWIKNNLSYNSRVAVLDVRAPHPSGMARVMVQAGVFAPVFSEKIRVYTIEASPEYFDLAYYLNPSALTQLKTSFLLIDSSFFESLPNLRKTQLENERYFRKIFDNSNVNNDWEKIYEVSDKYLKEGGEIKGSFKEFTEVLPQGRIYIENEENFNPPYIRRAIIFSARDKDIYYLPQSGVYLNVETYINQKLPRDDGNYDYLVLGRGKNAQNICKCQTKLIWIGLKDEVYLWQRIY